MPSLNAFSLPGVSAALETAEREILWGIPGNQHAPTIWKGVQLASGTVDTGSPTTDLRPGLILADMGDGTFREYDPASTTAAQRIPVAVLPIPVDMVDPATQTAVARYCPALFGAPVIASKLPNLDYWARAVLAGRFVFDDVPGTLPGPYRNEVAKTGNYTVTAADNGTLFTNTGASGAITFTLPARAKGLKYWFLVVADQTVTVASAAGDDIVTFNDASADSLAFSTSSEKIGGFLEVVCNQAGTKWYARNLSFANTVTVAT